MKVNYSIECITQLLHELREVITSSRVQFHKLLYHEHTLVVKSFWFVSIPIETIRCTSCIKHRIFSVSNLANPEVQSCLEMLHNGKMYSYRVGARKSHAGQSILFRPYWLVLIDRAIFFFEVVGFSTPERKFFSISGLTCSS